MGAMSFGVGCAGVGAVKPQKTIEPGHQTAQGESPRSLEPVAVVFLVDRSGSLGGWLSAAWRGCVAAVDELEPSDQVAFIAFDTLPFEVVPLQDVRALTELQERLDEIKVGGPTDFYPVLKRAHTHLRDAAPKHKVVLLLTDGLGPKPDLIEQVEAMGADGIKIMTVGIGGYHAQGLEEIASKTHGRFHPASEPKDLVVIVPSVVSDFVSSQRGAPERLPLDPPPHR